MFEAVLCIAHLLCWAHVVEKANDKNRNTFIWGAFALFVPVIAVVIIHSVEEKLV